MGNVHMLQNMMKQQKKLDEKGNSSQNHNHQGLGPSLDYGKEVIVVAKKQSYLLVLAAFLVAVMLVAEPNNVWAAPSSGQTGANQVAMVNLNQASLEDLTSVRGIGPSIAQRIVDYRTDHGSFESVSDLTRVKGIGQATYEKIKQQVTL